jgi:DNA repair exonuclease SbcCD nuclease subunit
MDGEGQMKPYMVISDPHFHNYKQHSKMVGGENSRLLHVVSAWRQAVEIAKAEGCELILVCGDIFHVRGNIRPSVYNVVSRLIANALQFADVVMIPGNHDMENYRGGETAIDSFKHITGTGRCHVLDFDNDNVVIDGQRIVGIPYIHDPLDFKETYANLVTVFEPDITMIHQGIDDFGAAGIPETKITAKWLMKLNSGVIFSGHYHSPQFVDRVINVGAPLQHSFGDEVSERGCWVHSEGGAEFRPISGTPRFVTITKSGKGLESQVKGNIVRIKAKDIKAGERLRAKVEEAGACSVVVQIDKEFTSVHEETIKLSTSRAMLAEFLHKIEKYKDKADDILTIYDEICTEA